MRASARVSVILSLFQRRESPGKSAGQWSMRLLLGFVLRTAPSGLRVARPERFELPTLWFEARCSIQLSYGRVPPSYQNSRATRWTVGGAFARRRDRKQCTGARSQGSAGASEEQQGEDGSGKNWWAWVDLNYRPHPYQGCALAT